VVFADQLAADPFSALPWPEEALVQTLGYQTKEMWQENGITVALLTIG
jgi:hypothetical protein